MIINIVWLKYVPFIIVGLAFVWATYKVITTEHLLDFIKKSLCEDNGKPSGRSIAGFACINVMLIGFLVSMYYAPGHCPPDWYVEALAFLIGSFYGLKEVGKFAKKGDAPPPPPSPETPVDPKPEPKKEDIG
jgi:hypothetical protein